MDSGPVLTIADLRQASNTTWCQDVELSIAFRRGEPLKVLLVPDLVLPKALFKFQLQQAVFEGTSNTGGKVVVSEGRISGRNRKEVVIRHERQVHLPSRSAFIP